MFTPKRSNPIMLEDDTVHTGHTHTQSLLLFATERKAPLCGCLESRKWSVTSVMVRLCRPLAP